MVAARGLGRVGWSLEVPGISTRVVSLHHPKQIVPQYGYVLHGDPWLAGLPLCPLFEPGSLCSLRHLADSRAALKFLFWFKWPVVSVGYHQQNPAFPERTALIGSLVTEQNTGLQWTEFEAIPTQKSLL